jgi:hypothetical protein
MSHVTEEYILYIRRKVHILQKTRRDEKYKFSLLNIENPVDLLKVRNNMRIYGIIAALLILTTAAISGCLSQPPTEKPITPDKTGAETSERKVSEAGVTIAAVYSGNNSFAISLDTHSGSLDYKMDEVSFIRDSKGNIIKPIKWDGGIGGHHLKGTLTFPKFDDNASFELVTQDVAGVKERVLKW